MLQCLSLFTTNAEETHRHHLQDTGTNTDTDNTNRYHLFFGRVFNYLLVLSLLVYNGNNYSTNKDYFTLNIHQRGGPDKSCRPSQTRTQADKYRMIIATPLQKRSQSQDNKSRRSRIPATNNVMIPPQQNEIISQQI